MFKLHKVNGTQLWMPPPATMETMMEVFNNFTAKWVLETV